MEGLKMKRKVKVLLVGAAFSANLHMDGYSRCTDIAEIVAVCDKDESRVDLLTNQYGLTNHLIYNDFEKAIAESDCDLVDICLPNFLHHDAALEAFKRGKNVISEKPLATTVEDAEEMVKAAEKAGRKLYYAEDWLFAPALNKA
jgi:myo-inositol 2-dehydrogenase / D-chiro-inositol 1-dehydrogenase